MMQKFYTEIAISFLLSIFFNVLHAQVTLTTLPTPAANANQGQLFERVYEMQIKNETVSVVNINQVKFTLSGTYQPSDLSLVNVLLSPAADFSSGALSAAASGAQPSGTEFNLPTNINFAMQPGSTLYLRIRINVASNATDGRTVFINGLTNPVLLGFTTPPAITNTQSNIAGIVTFRAAQLTLTTLATPTFTASQGQLVERVYEMQITNSNQSSVILNQVRFTLLGTYQPTDFTQVNVLISQVANFSSGALSAAATSTIQPSGTQFILPFNIDFTMPSGSTLYLRIRVNVASNATDGRTVFINGATHPVQLGFTTSPIVTNNQSNLAGIVTILASQVMLTTLPTPDTTASQGQLVERVYEMRIDNSNQSAVTINQVRFTLLGTYQPADLTSVNVILSPVADFSSGALSAATTSVIQPSGTQYDLPTNINFTIQPGNTLYLRIRVNMAADATIGRTVLMNGSTHPVQLGFTSSPIVANNQSNLSGSIILPLKLVYLNVQRKNKWAEISWATHAEYNMWQYEIEYSNNGIQYQVVASLPANATLSPQSNQYSFLHKQPIVGTNYYRLRMTDQSGQVLYSAIVVLKSNDISFQVYPNPAKDNASFKINMTHAGELNCVLIQSNGTRVWELRQALPQGNSVIPLMLRHLASGLYILKCTTPESTETIRLMIRK